MPTLCGAVLGVGDAAIKETKKVNKPALTELTFYTGGDTNCTDCILSNVMKNSRLECMDTECNEGKRVATTSQGGQGRPL